MKIGSMLVRVIGLIVVWAVAMLPAVAEEPPVLLPGGYSLVSETELQEAGRSGPGSAMSTLGLAPPSGAVVLFDGSNFDAWMPFSFQAINPRNDQKQIQWQLVDGKAMQIAFEHEGKKRKQFIRTKQKFGDYRLHLEFQLPEDGGKGNSGVFFGPLYELQILDSVGKESLRLTDCGAIYQIRVPDQNAARPPGEWQSVDLQYQAARINAAGYANESDAARVTVRLNGMLIHNNFKLSLRRNKYAAYPEELLSPIVLQEHGSPVKFRNIWLVNQAAGKEVPLKN